jgi:hypothetical protein
LRQYINRGFFRRPLLFDSAAAELVYANRTRTLYRSPAGRWFIVSQHRTGGQSVVLLTSGEALSFLFDHDAPGLIVKRHFGRAFVEA